MMVLLPELGHGRLHFAQAFTKRFRQCHFRIGVELIKHFVQLLSHGSRQAGGVLRESGTSLRVERPLPELGGARARSSWRHSLKATTGDSDPLAYMTRCGVAHVAQLGRFVQKAGQFQIHVNGVGALSRHQPFEPRQALTTFACLVRRTRDNYE